MQNLLTDHFHGLSALVPGEPAVLSGAWTAKPQRRYASPQQSGTGEGPFVDTVDWRWEGTLVGSPPLAGIALLITDQRVYWSRSSPPSANPAVSLSMAGWIRRPGAVSMTGSFHGAFLPSVPVEILAEPPEACVVRPSALELGTPQILVELGGVAFAVVLLPASAIEVARNRLWHLREPLAAQLRPEPRALLTRGRSGWIDRGDGA